jgi:hypothetical protein
VTAVDPWEGRRRINPKTGRSEVNMGGLGQRHCYVAPCPEPEDNWQPDPGMPWEQRGIDGKWEYPNLRKLAYPDEKAEDPKKDYKTITAVLDGAGYGPGETQIAQNIFSPLLPWNWGKNQSVGDQVQQGTYEPDQSVVSPTDQFLRGVSNRNRELQKIMDAAGW